MGRLDGQVAIITGGGSGFGKGIALKYVQEGAKVLITDLNEENGQNVAKEIGCEFQKANAVSKGDWEAVLKTAVDKFGGVNIVVNNAGATYTKKPTLDVTPDDFDICVNVNMKSIYYSVNVILPYIQKQKKGGSFIQIASTAGIRPRPGLVWYNASKAACINATKAMAVEYATEQIRFNAVCPVFAGGTGMTAQFLGAEDTIENRQGYISSIPIGRMCTPSDIANACCYLASDEAAMVTGITLEVDGGRCV